MSSERPLPSLVAQWTRLAGVGHEASGRDLLARYGEPHRRYHTAEHLAFMLGVIDQLADLAADADAVRYAAWFHDAVYIVGAENEELSARLAGQVLTEAGRPAALVAEVARLVRLTSAHDPRPEDRNGSVLCDADLAVLGGSPEQYRRYREQVRDEYRQVPDDRYAAGRAAILRGLLDQPRLYRTAAAHGRYERAARINLAAEIASLESRP
jgi:predicted metal-dependent HD superfamily phosphohydrolase